MPETLDISVVIPAYNEEESLTELNGWISRVMTMRGLSYEVLFVDEGSNDDTWAKIKKLSAVNSNIKGLKFNRNNGKSAALSTGFQYADGRCGHHDGCRPPGQPG